MIRITATSAFNRCRSLIVLACLLACMPPAFANDSTAGDRNGGIELLKRADIRMAKETLDISVSQVQVDYVFINDGATVTVPVAFPMPPMYFGDGDHSAVTDFRLWVNDKPVTTSRRLVILLDSVDISAQVEKLGWSERDLVDYLSEMGDREVPAGHKPLPKAWFDHDDVPRFTLHEYFIWQQTFPSGQPVRIRHRYAPTVSSSVPMPASVVINEHAESSCLDSDAKRSLQRMSRQSEHDAVQWRQLEYILTTGAHWKGGTIGEFNLRIHKPAPKWMVSLCWEGDLRKTDATTFEFSQRDFVPAADLAILFAASVLEPDE